MSGISVATYTTEREVTRAAGYRAQCEVTEIALATNVTDDRIVAGVPRESIVESADGVSTPARATRPRSGFANAVSCVYREHGCIADGSAQQCIADQKVGFSTTGYRVAGSRDHITAATGDSGGSSDAQRTTALTECVADQRIQPGCSDEQIVKGNTSIIVTSLAKKS
ncbi:MAG: hypothetical protein HWD60_08485 [Defluviicoccus sp.]|nr:MAG: hypothetical protein HWD60_08485 [Defluviicoccus sp.]